MYEVHASPNSTPRAKIRDAQRTVSARLSRRGTFPLLPPFPLELVLAPEATWKVYATPSRLHTETFPRRAPHRQQRAGAANVAQFASSH